MALSCFFLFIKYKQFFCCFVFCYLWSFRIFSIRGEYGKESVWIEHPLHGMLHHHIRCCETCFCWKDNRGVIDIATFFLNYILSPFLFHYSHVHKNSNFLFCLFFSASLQWRKLKVTRVKLYRTVFTNSISCVNIFYLINRLIRW